MIGRRGFITGLLASAAMPMLIDKHRVVHIGMDFGREPAIAAEWACRQPFLFAERNRYILVSSTFKQMFDEALAKSTA